MAMIGRGRGALKMFPGRIAYHRHRRRGAVRGRVRPRFRTPPVPLTIAAANHPSLPLLAKSSRSQTQTHRRNTCWTSA